MANWRQTWDNLSLGKGFVQMKGLAPFPRVDDEQNSKNTMTKF